MFNQVEQKIWKFNGYVLKVFISFINKKVNLVLIPFLRISLSTVLLKIRKFICRIRSFNKRLQFNSIYLFNLIIYKMHKKNVAAKFLNVFFSNRENYFSKKVFNYV